jgi:hypothetical protein
MVVLVSGAALVGLYLMQNANNDLPGWAGEIAQKLIGLMNGG